MEAATATRQQMSSPVADARRVDWTAVWTWLLGFGLVAYLGLDGGGYDPLVHDKVGIGVWWVLLLAVAVGALPRRRPSPIAWTALGLLAGFVAWTALSSIWTENHERTAADVARLAGYLGVFALALFSRSSKGTRRMVAAVGTGIAVVAGVALLSRLHPAWFPDGRQTVEFLTASRERLAYPLDYWNALAALVAIGLPLVLHMATESRTRLARAAAAGVLPALALTAFLTLSRAGIAAAAIAILVYLALTSERLSKLPTLLFAAAGGAILIAATAQRDALQEGLANAVARQQGDEILAMTLVVCLAVALLEAAFATGLPKGLRAPWKPLPRRRQGTLATALVLLAVLAGLALGGAGQLSSAWDDFKETSAPGAGAGRLSSASGEGRYQFWQAALREQQAEPLTGTGSGTFEFWWNRDGETYAAVRDTHSLYLQTLGELGLVGGLLLGGFLLTVLAGGSRLALTARKRSRSQLAAAVAGIVAFCCVAAVDWVWQIPVLPVAVMLLAAALLSAGPATGSRRLRLGPLRIAFAVAAVAAIFAIAIPLAAETQLRQSQEHAAAGRLADAYGEALGAANAEPGAAAPRLQQALLLEEVGDLRRAAAAARAATERASTDWHPWLVLSRIEAERGRAGAAVRAYARARSLNPNSPLFD